ncbi:Hsp20/alpha crystallin family protein [Methylobacter sp.]|uniref:Hsp20/alpha crystallin family protein n=1 Tax=Methylobacter sp. TaxID=2051955 RepID=UPI003DA505D2
MAITRYEPWSLLNQLQKELERAYEGTTGGEGSIATAEWAPAVDIKEESDRYVLLADLPGVKPEDIDLSMEEGVLTIKGEKKTEAKAQRENYKRVERTYGSFYRRFSLPDTANAEGISARSRHGVLEIVIPKREAIQPKKITVAAED